ncbi:MAG TPA: hypothetical protein VF110_06655 [Burkholderiales bacterium]
MSRYQIALANLERRRQITPLPADLRSIADEFPIAQKNWEWVAPHLSRRISGISELRARDLVARNGGSASEINAARH